MATHPRFEISKDHAGKFRFTLTARNGQVVLTSQGYSAKSGCKNGIASVKTNSKNDGAFARAEAKNGKHYFNLVAKNKQVIGTSQMYASKASVEKGIQSVRANSASAELHEA